MLLVICLGRKFGQRYRASAVSVSPAILFDGSRRGRSAPALGVCYDESKILLYIDTPKHVLKAEFYATWQ